MQYFKWDALGRLIRSKNDKAETHYRYDALGRRIEKQKQHIQAGRSQYTETTAYGWDGDTLAYESTNLYTKHYVYENSSFVPLIQATYRQQINQHQTPQWTNQYDYDKDPLWHTEQKANPFDRVWFYHCDHLGTPQEMSDQTGAIVWTANYKAWGECKTENHTKRDIWDSEIITNNLRFQGQYFDNETGLHYNRFRYYSPYVGRFISKDPIGLLGGFNTFTYAPNSVAWVDPLGLTSCKIGFDGSAIYNQKLAVIKKHIANHDYTNRPDVKLKVSGGVSGAIGYTKATGIFVGKGTGTHVEKGTGILNGLEKVMEQVDGAQSLCAEDKARLHAYADPYIKKLKNALALPVRVQPTGKRI